MKILQLLLIGLLSTNLFSNELIKEDSPYLQQHAHNPVAWMPWGEKALAKAKKENKLIFLSIGYSTCHWCHVMEHESFENEVIAKQLNEDFISIKVDREEYPNIDKYYQEVYRHMNNRSGGWPLTVVMTPDAKVFFTSTYIPSTPKYNYRSLPAILTDLTNIYKTRKEDVQKSADSIKNLFSATQNILKSRKSFDKNLTNIFVDQVKESYDFDAKGIGVEPKFPHATSFDTLLDIFRLTQNHKAKEMAIDALEAMARGGINDQIEGGFFRYSTDEEWMIPHFEKMLYTNAELIETYANGYKLTKKPYFKATIDATIENIYKRFEKNNLFYSASDADSDGEEGKYFLFTYKETSSILSHESLEYFNITKEGNFEAHKNNPYLSEESRPPKDIEVSKNRLQEIRTKRNYPFIDHKVQTSWNGLFIHALFKAKKDKKALTSLNSLVKNLYLEGRLYHQLLIGKKPKVKGYLEDYAFLIQALIDAYQSTLKKEYLSFAKKLFEQSKNKFYKNNTWYMSDDSFKTEAELYDSSYRSALAVNIENALKISILYEDFKGYMEAKKMLQYHAEEINAMPSSLPYATKVALMMEYPIITIKSNKEKLLASKKEIDKIGYPFILLHETNETIFEACTMEKCFSSHKKLNELIVDIEEEGNLKNIHNFTK